MRRDSEHGVEPVLPQRRCYDEAEFKWRCRDLRVGVDCVNQFHCGAEHRVAVAKQVEIDRRELGGKLCRNLAT